MYRFESLPLRRKSLSSSSSGFLFSDSQRLALSRRRYRSQQDTLDLSRNRRRTLQVAAKYIRPVAKSPQNVTGRSRIPSTCRKIAAKRYRSQQDTFDLSRNRRKTLPVAARYIRPVAKSPQNVTGRSKIPSTWHEIAAKRYRSQQDTFDLSQNRLETLQVAAGINKSQAARCRRQCWFS